LRLFFLARLLETEETVIAWRGQDEASIKAPDPISVPDPPPLAPAARIGPIAGGKGPFRMSLRFRRWFIFFSLIVVAAVTVIWLEKNKIGRPGVIHAYNGLSSPVTVTVGDVQHSVLSGSAVAINWPKGATSIMTHSPEGFIEIVEDIPEPERGQNLVYNVAGASPLFEWEAVYSLDAPEGPPTEIPLGAPKLLVTTADFVLTDPPKSAKVSANNPTKRVLSALSGVHPARMLELLNPQERLPVIEAQARWNRPGSLWSPLWLDLLASNSPKAAGILLSRVADFPRDPWTLGYLLKVLGAKNLVGFCLELQSLTNSDDDPDLAYLASLCLPAEERSQRLGELLKLWPNQPWLNRAAGWELFAKDDLEGALWYLDQAFEHDPSTLLPELETLARLRHLHGLPASILAEEFNFWVPGLATLTNRESAERRDFYRLSARDRSPESSLSPQDQAYVLLDRGLMSKALELAEPGPLHDRLTRLAGASAGADQEMVEKALTLPLDRGLDRDTAWSMLGLAVKHRRDTLPYAKIIAETSPAPAPLLAKAIMEGDAGNLGILIPGREAWLQGQACLAAEIAGLKLPEKCPLKARGFLFVGEKPYLTPLPPESRPTHNQSDPSDPYGHPTPDQPPDPFDLEGRPARDQAPDPASLPAPNQSTDPASPPATGTQGEIATSQGNPEASLPETPLESPLDSPHSSE
jgi:hypothetical protein